MVNGLWPQGAAYFGLAVLSAVMPWVNAEVVMLSAIPLAASHGALLALVLAVSAGQMTGKAAVYWMARTSTRTQSLRVQQAVARWCGRLSNRPSSALGVTFVSALAGVPP